jgi:hypothetical protein
VFALRFALQRFYLTLWVHSCSKVCGSLFIYIEECRGTDTLSTVERLGKVHGAHWKELLQISYLTLIVAQSSAVAYFWS